MLTPEPISLAKAHQLYAKAVTSTPSDVHADHLLGLAFHEGGYYVIATPRKELNCISDIGPFQLSAGTARFVVEDEKGVPKVNNEVFTANIYLMVDGNRWEWE